MEQDTGPVKTPPPVTPVFATQVPGMEESGEQIRDQAAGGAAGHMTGGSITGCLIVN